MIWLKKITKGLLWLVTGLIALVLFYLLSVRMIYTDISAEDLSQEYLGQVQTLDIPLPTAVKQSPLKQTLYYQDSATSLDDINKPALVLLHSHFFTMQMWDNWAEQLASDYRVIRFDLPSHGLTGPAVNNDYSIEADIYLMEQLLAHLRIQQVILVGSSLGGNLAFYYAAHHPDNVTAVVLQNSGGFRKATSRGGNGKDLPGWANYLLYALPKPAFDAFMNWMVINKEAITPELLASFHHGFRRNGNRYAEMQRLRQFDAGDSAALLTQITAPVLIQWGQENPQLPVEQVDLFQQALTSSSRVEVITYPNTGHQLALEAPQTGLADMQGFLNTLLVSQGEKEHAHSSL